MEQEHSAFAKGHNLNPGNYNHFEVDSAKSKLQYVVTLKWSRQPDQAYFEAT